MTTINGLQAATQRRIEAYWRTIPDTIRVADVLTMPWGGERNLALRKALGLPLESDEVCMVTQADVVQVVVDTRARARQMLLRLQGTTPPGWDHLKMHPWPDRRWLITASRTT
jgi:hypothetical protein